jgi:hypothetical protein
VLDSVDDEEEEAVGDPVLDTLCVRVGVDDSEGVQVPDALGERVAVLLKVPVRDSVADEELEVPDDSEPVAVGELESVDDAEGLYVVEAVAEGEGDRDKLPVVDSVDDADVEPLADFVGVPECVFVDVAETEDVDVMVEVAVPDSLVEEEGDAVSLVEGLPEELMLPDGLLVIVTDGVIIGVELSVLDAVLEASDDWAGETVGETVELGVPEFDGVAVQLLVADSEREAEADTVTVLVVVEVGVLDSVPLAEEDDEALDDPVLVSVSVGVAEVVPVEVSVQEGVPVPVMEPEGDVVTLALGLIERVYVTVADGLVEDAPEEPLLAVAE